MKSANDFVKQKPEKCYNGISLEDDIPFQFDEDQLEKIETVLSETTMEDVMITYDEAFRNFEKTRKELEALNSILGEDRNPSYYGVDDLRTKFTRLYIKYKDNKKSLTFNERWRFRCIIDGLLYHDMRESYKKSGVDLKKIKNELDEFEDIKNYLYVRDSVNGDKQQVSRCLCDDISFDTMYLDGRDNTICSVINHHFIRVGDELRCVFCGASTKEYNLTKEQVDFLEKAAEAQHKLMKGIKEEDMPLLQLLVMEENAAMTEYDKYVEGITGSEEKEEKRYEFDGAVHSCGKSIEKHIKRAHRIDTGDYKDKWGNITYFQKYFDDERAAIELAKVEHDLELARTMSLEPESRRNTVQKLKTKKYEILILSGKTIPGIFERLTDDEDKECFVKAYANLNDEEYRKNSGYFEGKKLGSEVMYPYSCITAIPEINRRLLDMKLKNTNN